jgi:hypothetical protein
MSGIENKLARILSRATLFLQKTLSVGLLPAPGLH